MTRKSRKWEIGEKRNRVEGQARSSKSGSDVSARKGSVVPEAFRDIVAIPDDCPGETFNLTQSTEVQS
jgi:hypothetical protein